LRGNLQGTGDRIAARSEEPAHYGVFDQAANLVGIETQADHGIGEAAFVLMAQALCEAVLEQAVRSEHVLETAQQAVQGDHADLCHSLAAPGSPAATRAVFTVCLQSPYQIASATPNLAQVTYWSKPPSHLCGAGVVSARDPIVQGLEPQRGKS
jgi:hypothetical protein